MSFVFSTLYTYTTHGDPKAVGCSFYNFFFKVEDKQKLIARRKIQFSRKFILNYRNFLTRITDTITSKLPNIAATIISIIIDAFSTNIVTSNHSISLGSGRVVVELNVDPYIFDMFDENSNKNSI